MHAEEGVELQEGAMETLAKVSGGDLRKAITTLQSAVRLKVQGLNLHCARPNSHSVPAALWPEPEGDTAR